MGVCRPFLRNFRGLMEGNWRKGGKYTKKNKENREFCDYSRMRKQDRAFRLNIEVLLTMYN